MQNNVTKQGFDCLNIYQTLVRFILTNREGIFVSLTPQQMVHWNKHFYFYLTMSVSVSKPVFVMIQSQRKSWCVQHNINKQH